MKKMRLVYGYFGVNAIAFAIPVQSIYEAALIKHNIAFTDLKKKDYSVIPDYCSFITLEVCLDEENDEWADWVDEEGYDDMDAWLQKHEPEHYAHIKELFAYYRDFENE